jgi:2,4-dienoyl-CoA reductase-like NADH-dependent reductase (Old Yellow Enzyme family)
MAMIARGHKQPCAVERLISLPSVRPFVANPDLVRRYRDYLPLNAADPATVYGCGEQGYTDYPFYCTEYLTA